MVTVYGVYTWCVGLEWSMCIDAVAVDVVSAVAVYKPRCGHAVFRHTAVIAVCQSRLRCAQCDESNTGVNVRCVGTT